MKRDKKILIWLPKRNINNTSSTEVIISHEVAEVTEEAKGFCFPPKCKCMSSSHVQDKDPELPAIHLGIRGMECVSRNLNANISKAEKHLPEAALWLVEEFDQNKGWFQTQKYK